MFPGHTKPLLLFLHLYLKIIKLKLTEAKVINKNKLVKLATRLMSPTKAKTIVKIMTKNIAAHGVFVLS